MKEIELVSKRGKREKHFLQQDGSIIARMYSEDIHFEKNGKMEEIDNRLERVGNYYRNKSNSFIVKFLENSHGEILRYELNNNDYLTFEILNVNDVQANLVNNNSQFIQKIQYNNIFDGIDLEYCINSNKVKENIIIKCSNNIIKEIKFKVRTNLKLQNINNKLIKVFDGDNHILNLDVPFMLDQCGKTNKNCIYELQQDNNCYILTLKLDEQWLSEENRAFPVIIDPIIAAPSKEVQDTFICPSDPYGYIKPYEMYVLTVGVCLGIDSPTHERVREPNRILLKFGLPTIGTGSQVIGASLSLINFYGVSEFIEPRRVDIHRVTKDWTEQSASWNSMKDNYDSRIESTTECTRGVDTDEEGKDVFFASTWDVTSLVKEWYSGVPNYGMMLKTHDEIDNGQTEPVFFSSRYPSDGTFLYPTLEVIYRNQTGIENYMDYQVQNFASGYVTENIYNGNITACFDLNNTIGSALPTQLSIFYNTNDVILNKNFGYGKGLKFNFQQYIQKVKIGNIEYLEYLDSDGTIHYFVNSSDGYKDEDGLNMIITEENNYFYLKLKDTSEMKFQKINNTSRLIEYKNPDDNLVTLNYNTNGLLSKLIDSDGKEININYMDSEIIVSSDSMETKLYYTNNQLVKIDNIDGETSFEYNSQGLIRKIINVDGTSIEYTYYEQNPYKVKKVIEKGKNGMEGQSFSIEYGNKVTVITDYNGNVVYFNFNDIGNPITTSIRKGKDILDGALAAINTYGSENNPDYVNKLLSIKMPSGYVNNYLKNSSFENEQIYFLCDSASVSLDTECVYDGKNSLKIISQDIINKCFQDVNVPKGKDYVFSAYLKSNVNCMISLSYEDENSNNIEVKSEKIFSCSDFERHDVSIYYPEDATSPLKINIYLLDIGILYLDNIQLELGEVASEYNYIENSCFTDSFTNWELLGGKENNSSFSIVDIPGNEGKAMKIDMDPDYGTALMREFNIRGKKGDEFVISFWYKNNGINTDMYNAALVSFNYINEVPIDVEPNSLNPCKDQWQFFSTSYIALEDYDKITLDIFQDGDANDLYITNISLFKNIRKVSYDYDNCGNIISSIDEFGNRKDFKYDNKNQVVNFSDPLGKSIFVETDNENINRQKTIISETGISTKLRYDTNGNQISTKIMKRGIEGKITNGNYSIRGKGTDKYLVYCSGVPKMQEQYCNPSSWVLEQDGDYFKIKHPLLSDKFLTLNNNQVIFSNYSYDNSLFDIAKNDNGSYVIKCKLGDNYLKINDNCIEVGVYIPDDAHFQFYFEISDDGYFIENDIEYDNNNVLKSVTNELMNKKEYVMDTNKYLTTAVIDEAGHKINYDYSSQNELIKLQKENRNVNYSYTDGCMLDSINQNGQIYNFEYDEFGNVLNTTVGNKYNLLTNVYEINNGNLAKVMFGNNQTISYKYDDFNRLIHVEKPSNSYDFKYNSNSNLAKIISADRTEKYYYDLGQRLRQYNDDKFAILYNYDSNSNVVSKKYRYGITEYDIINSFNSEDAIIESHFNSHFVSYNYSSLGMLQSSSFDNNYISKSYEYFSNGKRISSLIKKVTIGDKVYSYKYDKLKNLTHIYCNNNLENKYYYDEFNQLIREDNYLLNRTVRYKYDIYGNMTYVTEYKLNSYEYIKQDKFNYGNENWKSQLTRYNDKNITYDNIGNMLSYGNDITFSWNNGKELSQYINSNANINVNYKYNVNGVRNYKNVNGLEIKYYLEGNNVIFETIGDDILYFIRNEVDDLLGFKYNDNLYFYVKNEHDDIIGILDSNYNIVAKYSYDSWGKPLTITDGYGNDCTRVDNHIANINPFRYRSYYYDSETGLYYLNARYYDPDLRRFISADNVIMQNMNIIGNNLYVYADNNPINLIDPYGHGILSWIKQTAKKIYNGVKKVVKAVVGFVKDTVNTVKKVYKSIEKTGKEIANTIKKSFTFEFGTGAGASAGVKITKGAKASIGYYEDFTIKIESGKVSKGTTISASKSAELGKIELGDDISLFHEFHQAQNYSEGGISYNKIHTNPFPLLTEIIDCDRTEITGSYSGKSDNAGVSVDNNDKVFYGVDLDLHAGIGFHLKIGFTF